MQCNPSSNYNFHPLCSLYRPLSRQLERLDTQHTARAIGGCQHSMQCGLIAGCGQCFTILNCTVQLQQHDRPAGRRRLVKAAQLCNRVGRGEGSRDAVWMAESPAGAVGG